MKKKVLLLSALQSMLCSAQSVVCYTHDSTGNRERQFYSSNRQHFSLSLAILFLFFIRPSENPDFKGILA